MKAVVYYLFIFRILLSSEFYFGISVSDSTIFEALCTLYTSNEPVGCALSTL